MEIVTGEPAPTVDRDEAVRLLHEMAAVVRTVFAVAAPAPATMAAPVPPPVPAAPGAPAAPPVGTPPLAPLPVPSLALPVPPDPEERPSLALLQEIAFLDE
ncbi:MAG TPA: hypothetical protein VGE14_05315 [Marmoricola sp.]